MPDTFLDGLKALAKRYKGVGARMGKAIMVEYFIESNHDEIVHRLNTILMFVRPKDVRNYIETGQALPIPPKAFEYLVGFEDWLKGFDPGRLFEFIAEANPKIAEVIIQTGDEGALYMVKFKQFIVDSVLAISAAVPDEDIPTKDLPPEQEEITPDISEVFHHGIKFAGGGDEEEEKEEVISPEILPEDIPANPRPVGMKKLICDACNETWEVKAHEVDLVTECPFCHAPA